MPGPAKPPTPEVVKFHGDIIVKDACQAVNCLSNERINAIAQQSGYDYAMSCAWADDYPEAVGIELTMRCSEGPGNTYLGGVACRGETLCIIAPSTIPQE